MIQQNISLKNFNSFGINVTSKYFASFNSIEKLTEILHNNNADNKLVLGGGSNILFTKNFDGIVLKNEIEGIKIIKEDNEYAYVQASSGELWHDCVMFCISHNLGGAENLSLIPGCVGAAPIQNIGAYGVELKDIFYSLEAYNFLDKKLHYFNLNDCEFGYRESVFKTKFKGQFVITSITLKLYKHYKLNLSYGAIENELLNMGIENPNLKNVSDAVINIRKSKLPNPLEIGNAGSFFKNPEISKMQFEKLKSNFENIAFYSLANGNIKLAAGWLIEQCGFKGQRINDVGCHPKQALVLVNYGNATGIEILDFSKKIIETVEKKFGVILEKEVNVI